MSYATASDAINAFGEKEVTDLTDRANTGSLDSAVLTAALAAASVEIDGYIGARYPTPVVGSIPLLKTACLDIARYRLYDDALHEVADTRYARTLSFLKDVGAGRAVLLYADGSAVLTRTVNGVNTSIHAGARTIATAEMRGY